MRVATICDKCKKLWRAKDHAYCPTCADARPTRSKLYKNVSFAIFPGHTTDVFNGEAVKLHSRKEETALCEEFEVHPAGDYDFSDCKQNKVRDEAADGVSDATFGEVDYDGLADMKEAI